MKTKILLAFATLTSLNAQNLKLSVEEVLSTNPVVLERLQNYKSTQKDITTAKSGYYPKLDLNLGLGIEDTKKSNQARNAPDTTDYYHVYQNSLKYTHNLFDGMGTTYKVKGQEYRTVSAAYSYIEKVNDRSFALVNAYLQVMKNNALLETAQENVDIDQEIFGKVQKLYDAGLTTLSEVNKIESSLALAKSNLVVQENTILNTSYQLENVLGRTLNPKEMSKPELDVTLPKTREDALKFAIKNNPSILVSDYNIKLANATKREKESVYYPKIDIEVSESMNKNLSAIEGNNDKFRAMAYLSYNFFNGFADKASVEKSLTNIQQEKETKNNLKRKVIQGLNLAWAANKKIQEQLKYLKEYKKYSLKTLTLYNKEYELGRRSLLDLLSTQNDFIRSKSQIITAEYDLLFAKYRILDAMGTLVDTVLGDKNIAYNNVDLTHKN